MLFFLLSKCLYKTLERRRHMDDTSKYLKNKSGTIEELIKYLGGAKAILGAGLISVNICLPDDEVLTLSISSTESTEKAHE